MAAITAGPTQIDCGHSGHYFCESGFGSLFNIDELNGVKVIITQHLDTQFNGAHASCGLPNCLVALYSSDDGVTWSLSQGPTFPTYLNNGTLVVGNTNYGSAANNGQNYSRSRSTRIGNIVYTTYQSADTTLSVIGFDLATLTWLPNVVITSSCTNRIVNMGTIAPNGIGVVCTNRVPPGTATPVVFQYAQFSVLTGFLNSAQLISPNNQDNTAQPEAGYVDDVGIIRIIYKTVSLDNLTAYRVVAGWPTDQAAPTIYDETFLGDASQTRFHDGYRTSNNGNIFRITERRATSASAINVFTYTRNPDNTVTQTSEQAVDNAVEGDNFAYVDVAVVGACRVLFIASDQASAPVHGWQLKLKTRGALSWPVGTPSPVIYTALGDELRAVLGTYFGGDIIASGEYEFLTGANNVVDPVQFTVTQQIYYWRMTIPTCPGQGMLTLIKDVNGTALPTDFTLSAAGPTPISGAGGVGAVDVDPGVYPLSETSVPGYTEGDWVCVGGVQAGANVTIAADDVVVCTIQNSQVVRVVRTTPPGGIAFNPFFDPRVTPNEASHCLARDYTDFHRIDRTLLSCPRRPDCGNIMEAEWVEAPKGATQFNKTGHIALPAPASGDTLVMTTRVPFGYDGILLGHFHLFTVLFDEGSGDLVWRVRVNGRYLRDMGQMLFQFGSLQNLSPCPGGLWLYSGNLVEYIVSAPNTGGSLPTPGQGQIITGLSGWFFPRK